MIILVLINVHVRTYIVCSMKFGAVFSVKSFIIFKFYYDTKQTLIQLLGRIKMNSNLLSRKFFTTLLLYKLKINRTT